jgi:formate dehydrogenase iron-sulfur subunit
VSLGDEQARPRGWPESYDGDAQPRMGFFTDTSLCIGCKACEVACKEWNQLPTDDFGFKAQSYDNTGRLSSETWRHVAFIEQTRTVPAKPADEEGMRWLMSSDVCKHCTTAPCLDVCPTGALFRTEFGTVVVQDDVCNGCGMCVPACPFGVIERREEDGRAWKCTLCYDRLKDDMEPACAKACPTDSIKFGPLDELREHAGDRIGEVVAAGEADARLYLHDSDNGMDGVGAFFLLLDEPEVYGLPPDPVAPTRHLGEIYGAVASAAAGIALGVAAAFVRSRR